MDAFELPLKLLEDVWRNPSVASAKRLSDELDNKRTLNIISSGRENAVLVTILKILSGINASNKNEIIVHLIHAVTKIVESTRVHSLISLKTILVILLKEIYDGQTNCVRLGLSEELKLAVVNCAEVSLRRSAYEVVEQFYTKENLILVAQMLSVCVDVINKENYRQLRIAAIKCIMSLEYVHDAVEPDDIVLRHQVADEVFVLLPKVVFTLTQVATGDDTQGHALIAISLTALGRIFRLIFEDDLDETSISVAEQTRLIVLNGLKKSGQAANINSAILTNTLKSVVGGTEGSKTQEAKGRTKEWLQAASQKCLPLIEKLHKLIGSKHAIIRKELSALCCALLTHCQRNMAPCVPSLLQISLGLGDEQPSFVLDDNALEIVENLFIEHLVKLPRIFYTGDEDEQTANTAQLHGSVSALCKSDRIRITLANEAALRSLASALLSAVELDLTSKLLEGKYTVFELGEDVTGAIVNLQNNTPWKVYRNLRNEAIITTIAKICQLLGDSPTASTFLIDFLLKGLHSNASNCNEVLVLLQLVLKSQHSCGAHCEMVIEELLVDSRWTLSTTVIESDRRNDSAPSKWFEDRTEGLYESAISMRISDDGYRDVEQMNEVITLNDVKFNILHTALVMETLGLCATKMKERFQPFLLRSLSYFLEKSASRHNTIQMSAVLALDHLKKAFELNSIADLITNNADYITFSINSAMKCADRCPAALDILKVVLHYCSLESMPHLENIIATVLHEGARTIQSSNRLSFIELFRMVLMAVRRTLGATTAPNRPIVEVGTEKTSGRNWMEMLYAIEAHSEQMAEDAVETGDEDVAEADPEQKTPKPALVEQTDKIMKRCVRSLASTNREEKIATFETLCIGLDILRPYDDLLLPMVHLIWGPFTQQCFRDKSPIVLRRCISLLSRLATYAQDFIYKRFVTEILPFILGVFSDLSKCEFEGFLYEQTQQFKLLQELLTNLDQVLVSIEIQERDFDKVLEATIWLLDSKQSQQLQEKGVKFFKDLFEFDRAAVYVKLIKYQNDPSGRFTLNSQQIINRNAIYGECVN